MERKLATVLFADLVGSTALGEQDPERTRVLMERFYDSMAAEVDEAGGTVEKFVGDAVMAAFGAPAALEDHAERALHAALAMQRRLRDLFGDELQLRIGVNTGEVVVGAPREGSSFVTGDAVNVGARLEQAAEPGEILVGERTVAAVRGAFEFAGPSAVAAKGKPGGVACRRLVRSLSLMRPRGVAGLRRAFVGRDRELAALESAYGAVRDERRPSLVTIVGDAGVGKTRLVRELWERLGAESPEPLRRTGRCLPYGRGTTYWALGEILKEQLGILESDSPETIRDRLAPREVLGLTLGLEAAGDLHPLAARDRLHAAWVDLIEEIAGGEQPLVILVEDLHWAHDELLELVRRLVQDVRGPLLVLATARSDLRARRPDWGARRDEGSLLELEPLSPEDSELLVAELLATELPAGLRRALERAEGNPFFVEELLAMLVDRGVIRHSNGAWSVAGAAAELAVPDSVHALVAARIDLLRPTEKAALQAASVIGRIFWSGPVYELIGGEDPSFDELEARDFVRRRHASSLPGEREFAIKHALTREVAYGGLPKVKRARMHAAFAAWIERLGEGRDEHASLLGHHYAEAVRPEDADLVWAGEDAEHERLRAKAVTWLTRAGTLAVGRYEIDDGLELLRRALELEPRPDRQGHLWHEIGRAHALKFDGEPFWTAMQRAIELADDPAETAELYGYLALQTASRSGMWRRRPDDELVRGWIARALDLAPPRSSARAQALLASVFAEDPAAAQAAAEASAIAEHLGDPELRSMAWGARAHVAMAAGDYEAALGWAERSYEHMDELRDPDLRADVHAFALTPALARGRFRESRRLAAEFDAVCTTLTDHHRVHGVAFLLEVEELAAGWERIRELEPRATEAVEANLETPCVRNARSLLLCALARLHDGDEAGAMALEQRAEELSPEGYGPVLDAPRARLALIRGDLATVRGLLERPALTGRTFFLNSVSARLDGLAALGDRERVEAEAERVLRPRTYLEPFALRALGVVRDDEKLVARAAELFEAMSLRRHAEETRKLVAQP